MSLQGFLEQRVEERTATADYSILRGVKGGTVPQKTAPKGGTVPQKTAPKGGFCSASTA